MARISTYALSTPADLSDKLIGSDLTNATKNFTVESIIDLTGIPAGTDNTLSMFGPGPTLIDSVVTQTSEGSINVGIVPSKGGGIPSNPFWIDKFQVQGTMSVSGNVAIGTPRKLANQGFDLNILGEEGKIAFGDNNVFGDPAIPTPITWNVVVGEYGTGDTDILQLHGKTGAVFTRGTLGETVSMNLDDAGRVGINTTGALTARLTVGGDIIASNLSGTNTGDQNLAGVLSLGNTTNGNDIAISAADNITLTDTSKIIMGADSDLETYHDGIKGNIKNITGALNIQSNNIEIGTFNNSATGLRSIAIGANTTASNTDAIAMGENTTATGISSTAIGKATNASADGATSMGNGTTASGVNSTSMGVNTTASGDYSTATGNNTTASGDNSFSTGANTTASGERSTSTGNGTLASGVNSTATGINTIASGNHSTAMGNLTVASGNHSTAMGNNTTAIGTNSISAGSSTTAGGNNSFAVGFSTAANGNVATAMGNSTVASGDMATAMGLYSVASGVAATATGYDTEASGANSTAMGKETTASGEASFATGLGATASGDYSTASGRATFATGNHSFAAGFLSRASGEYSTAMGKNTTASGERSVSIGEYTIANSFSEIALGRNPVPAAAASATLWVATDRLFSIGNGASAGSQSMALEILKNGITVLPGVVSLSFADDTAAATGGVPVGGLYHTSGAIKIRLT